MLNKIHHQLLLSSVYSDKKQIKLNMVIPSMDSDTQTYNHHNNTNNNTNNCQSITFIHINNPVEDHLNPAKCTHQHPQIHILLKRIIFKLSDTFGVDSIIKHHRKSFRRKIAIGFHWWCCSTAITTKSLSAVCTRSVHQRHFTPFLFKSKSIIIYHCIGL